jgi:hypothetical protein
MLRSAASRSMLSRRRLPFLVAFPALYIGVAAIRAGDARPSAWLLIAVAVAVALIGARVAQDGAALEPLERSRVWTATGLSIAIATAALSTRPAWAALAREAGTFFAMLGALRAIRSIQGDVGLAPKATEAAAPADFGPTSIHRAAVVTISLTWGTAAIIDGIALFEARTGGDGAAVFVATGAGTIALITLLATALLIGAARRLELTVSPRAFACAGGAGAGIVIGLAVTLGGIMPVDAAAAFGGAIASALIVRLARTSDALSLAKSGRRALTLVVFGGPLVALVAVIAAGRDAGGLALVLAILAVLVGTFAKKLEEPFLPVKGIMLDALRDAREAAREREARAAMAHALMRIREACAVGLGPTAAPSPELWLLHPIRVITVNAAGYLQERTAELPDRIFDVALGEPHGTLRTSVLRALEVRRADLRPLLAWLEQRDAIFATVIAESEDPDGLLVVPAGARTEELTLEEVRAAKLLADAFVAVSQATSAKERHLGRERELKLRIDALDDEAARLKHTIALDVGRHALAAARLARPATVGIYSAISRMAYEALERRIGADAPTVLVAAAGIDPIPFVARAHLGGPRKDGPFVVVDGTSTREHDLERWTDERTSPLALANHGLLLLVDGGALPRDIQVLIARAASERRPPWERADAIDIGLALSTTRSLEELAEAGQLAPELGARFEEAEAIVLPRLRDRSEDLHSIVADRLAREGLRVSGRPMGIDAAAFGRLVEYAFDGEDAELAAIVTRLVANARQDHRDVVRSADVDALGLVYPEDESDARRWPEGARKANRLDD